MVRYFARCFMLVAAFGMVIINPVLVGSISQAQAAEPDRRAIDRCVAEVNKRAKSLGSKFPQVVHEAAIRTCWITENRKAGLGVLDSLSMRGLQRAVDERDAGFRIIGYNGFEPEPTVFGLSGGEAFAREMLEDEARGIWALSAEIGGPPVPESEAAYRARVEEYVTAYLTALRHDPDTMMSVRTRLFLKMKRAALARTRTPAEAEFIRSMEAYAKRQYIRMAAAAFEKYKAYKAAEADKPSNQSMMAMLGNNEPLPDFHAEMRARITLGAAGGALVGSIVAVTANTAAIASAASTAAQGLSGNFAMVAFNNVSYGMSLNATGIAGASATTLAGAASVVAVSIMIGVMEIEKVIKRDKAEKEINQAVARANAARVSLKSQFGTRDGTMQIRHFFAKATSKESPADYTPPAEGCRACFYTEQAFEGTRLCVKGRVNDLKAAMIDGVETRLHNQFSSVHFENEKCAESYAVLYDNRNLKGTRIVLKQSVPDLSLFQRGTGKKTWDDAANSVIFMDRNAPKCEVCLFGKANYSGAKLCTDSAIASLKKTGLNDNISSVLMNTRDCPDARAWLFIDANFDTDVNGTGVYEYAKSATKLTGTRNNTTSSVYFAADGVNPFLQKAAGGCRLCAYEHANHQGRYVCINQNIPDMANYSVAGVDHPFANVASSVQFIKDDCAKGEELVAELYTKANYRGAVRRLFGNDILDFSKDFYSRNSGTNYADFDDNIHSMRLRHTRASSVEQRCKACLYTELSYGGEELCVTSKLNRMPSGFGDRVSSIRMQTEGCPSGGMRIHNGRNLDGDRQLVYESVENLRQLPRDRGNWDNRISSVNFAANMKELVAQAQAMAQQAVSGMTGQGGQQTSGSAPGQQTASTPREPDPTTLCQVCLYADTNYRGAEQCLTANASSLSSSVSNKASSMKVFTGACPKGGAIVYGRGNYNGNSAYILKSDSNLRDIRGSDNNWNNTIASVKFSKTMRDSVFATFKRRFLAVPDAQIWQMVDQAYGPME